MRQAKSKQKILDKMEAVGLTKPVVHTRSFTFTFPDCDKLPPPVLPFIDVSFAYSGKEEDMLYRVRPHADAVFKHLFIYKRVTACLYPLQQEWVSSGPTGSSTEILS